MKTVTEITEPKFKFEVNVTDRSVPFPEATGFLNKVIGTSEDEVFFSKKVQKLVAKIPGKKIEVCINKKGNPEGKLTVYTVKRVCNGKSLVWYKLVKVECLMFDEEGNEIDDEGNLIDDTDEAFLKSIRLKSYENKNHTSH